MLLTNISPLSSSYPSSLCPNLKAFFLLHLCQSLYGFSANYQRELFLLFVSLFGINHDFTEASYFYCIVEVRDDRSRMLGRKKVGLGSKPSTEMNQMCILRLFIPYVHSLHLLSGKWRGGGGAAQDDLSFFLNFINQWFSLRTRVDVKTILTIMTSGYNSIKWTCRVREEQSVCWISVLPSFRLCLYLVYLVFLMFLLWLLFIDFQRDIGLVMKSILGKWRDSSLIPHPPVVHDSFSPFHVLSLLLAVVWKNIPWNWIFLSWDCWFGEELSSHHGRWEPHLFI